MTKNESTDKVEQKEEAVTKKDSSYYDSYMASLDPSKRSHYVYKEKLKRRGRKSTTLNVLKSMNPYDVIIKPLTETEKGRKAMEEGRYIFKVHKDANKNDIKTAFRLVFNKSPQKVNVMNVPFKGRSNRKLVRRGFKKAIIVLKKGEKIELVSL